MVEKFIVSNIDEFNTSEGYFGDSFIMNNNIVIPYFNMGLMEEHPINMYSQQVFIDFCFLQIYKPMYLSVYERGIIINQIKNYDPEDSVYYGGLFIGNNSQIDSEMEIQASDVFLILPKDYNYSFNIWIPDYKEFKGKGNILEDKVIAFLSKKPPKFILENWD